MKRKQLNYTLRKGTDEGLKFRRPGPSFFRTRKFLGGSVTDQTGNQKGKRTELLISDGLHPSSVLVPSKARSYERSVLAPFLAMPFVPSSFSRNEQDQMVCDRTLKATQRSKAGILKQTRSSFNNGSCNRCRVRLEKRDAGLAKVQFPNRFHKSRHDHDHVFVRAPLGAAPGFSWSLISVNKEGSSGLPKDFSQQLSMYTMFPYIWVVEKGSMYIYVTMLYMD